MKSLVFDTETTDLVKNSLRRLEDQPYIIEFFSLTLQGEEQAPTHFLFKPPHPLTEEIKRITSINDDMLADAPKFSEKAEELKALIESHDEVIAHNATFDMTMVDNEMKRCGLTVNWPTVICTVEATEFMKGHRLKLANLHELLFGEVFLGAHRAENDVRALARCLLQLRAMGVV